MEEELVLRDLASLEEVPDLLDTWRSSVERKRDFLSAADLDAVATALEAVYSQRVQVKVVWQGSRILGFIAWNDSQIELLWVRHSERQQGIGRLMLDAVLAISPGVSIQLERQRQLAIAFFEDCGFSQLADGGESASQRVLLQHQGAASQNMAR